MLVKDKLTTSLFVNMGEAAVLCTAVQLTPITIQIRSFCSKCHESSNFNVNRKGLVKITCIRKVTAQCNA